MSVKGAETPSRPDRRRSVGSRLVLLFVPHVLMWRLLRVVVGGSRVAAY